MRRAGAHVELTRNQRALDPADRREQALFREGEHERAIRGYAARDRVHLAKQQRHAEDHALDAAQADRAAGRGTIVLAQTSNEQLDQLNARAQAIRQQHGELGRESVRVPGRSYRLHVGDEIQVRRTIAHPEHGRLRNGTTANVVRVDPGDGSVTLMAGDGQQITLDREQATRADLRLAYVQHPFPAQGQTTDTAHLIVAEHTTREGAYVCLTRARHETHIWAAVLEDTASEPDRLAALAARTSRSEPDIPSIRVPVRHETELSRPTEPAEPQPDRVELLKADTGQPTVDSALEQTGAEIQRRWPSTAERDPHPLLAELDSHLQQRPQTRWEAEP